MGKKDKKGNKYKNKKKHGNRVVRPEVVFAQSLMELLCEYQSKYTNLFNLSKEYDHKLLDAIACEIYQRLTHLMNDFQGVLNGHSFTQYYRRVYPHCDDLKLIQQKVLEINHQLGQPPREVSVETLTPTNADISVVNNFSTGELLGSSCRIVVPLAIKIESHINNLNVSENGPTKIIREALKKQAAYIQEILTETINETVMPAVGNKSYGQMRIYGEPYLPAANVFRPFLAKFCPTSVTKSHRMFNCALVNVPNHHIENFLKNDQTVVANVRLYFRRSIQPEYRLPAFIVQKIKEFFGIVGAATSIGLNYDEEAEDDAEDEVDEGQDGEQSDDSDE